MGAYMYKVTAKRVPLTDGTHANLAVYAYKPSFSTKENARMEKQSACFVADRFVQGKNFTGKVVLGTVQEDGKTAMTNLKAYYTDSGVFEDGEICRKPVAGDIAFIDSEKQITNIVKG